MLLGGLVIVFGQVVECSQKLGEGCGWWHRFAKIFLQWNRWVVWTGDGGRSNLIVTAGCWFWWLVVTCSGRLLGGFGSRSRAGGTHWVHISRREVVTGEGWGFG